VRFPALKGQQLLAILLREPLAYAIVRQKGSHRKLCSARGFPDIGFSFHDSVTIPPGVVRKILVADVGLSEAAARALV
jgi:predicted RNA binding protein YcfA (HicA-like mRNA interferase family)